VFAFVDDMAMSTIMHLLTVVVESGHKCKHMFVLGHENISTLVAVNTNVSDRSKLHLY